LDKKITDYKPLQRNPNKGTQRGSGILDQSVRELGAGRSLLVDKNGVILAGNHAQEAFVNAGLENVIEVETDGNSIVVVKRTDMDANSTAGKKMAIMDNRTSEQGLAWDAVVLEELMQEIQEDDGELDMALEKLHEEISSIDHDDFENKAGASPWDRMSGDGAAGVIFTFGSITCKLPQSVYDDFYNNCPDDEIESYIIGLLQC
jgi:hypothetical protein